MSSLDDSTALRRAKSLVPQPAKQAVGTAVRLGGTATAAWRPGPDVLVVGAKRSGTTFLWSALLSHPQVLPLLPAAQHVKSPHWFTRHADRSEAWYRGHFPTTATRRRHALRHGAALAVEADPAYLFDPRVATRAHQVLPDACIVVLLRDPVERAYSHYRERVKAGVESLGFAEALAAEPGRLAGERERLAADPTYHPRALDWYSYRARGEYADQVAAWLEAYGPDRVLVLRSEDMYADPAAALGRVQDHVGLDRRPPASTRRNRAPGDALPAGPAEELRAHYEPHTKELARLLGTEVWW
ncbi:sulfotransferase family protein [Nocardioides sp. CPCC 205120]|uniref:sulfotransferase family protein n=1 Tax=Nocardioides sp. CPCC 205120 TaxID=3406462 RepID=UPI003B5017EF